VLTSLVVMSYLTLAACSSRTEYLDIATTETVNNSGLLAELLPAGRGVAYRVHATDSAHAIAMLYDEVVDLAITHDAFAEARALREQPIWAYRKLAYNYLVLVGPKDDPAHVREAADVEDAFRRLSAAPVTYIARDDDSDIRKVEQRLWRNATFGWPRQQGQMVTRTGLNSVLNEASDRQGYAMTDVGAFWRLEKRLDLAVVFERDPGLSNNYAVIYSRVNGRAARLGEWLAGEDVRRRIAGYRVQGRPVFTLWPEGCPDTQAGDAPCRLNAAGKPIKDETLFVDGSGPPRTLREMKAGADAVVVVRYTGRSHEFPGPAPTGREELPRYERLGVFELLEVLKPHSALPTSGQFEIVVPGSYQDFPRYILHRSSDGVDEPQAERTYVIFLHYLGPGREVAWRSKWSEWSFYDVSGDHPKALASRSPEPNARSTKAFLEALRAR
jgi:tungstate transport system substrate-binding protein